MYSVNGSDSPSLLKTSFTFTLNVAKYEDKVEGL